MKTLSRGLASGRDQLLLRANGTQDEAAALEPTPSSRGKKKKSVFHVITQKTQNSNLESSIMIFFLISICYLSRWQREQNRRLSLQLPAFHRLNVELH